MTVSSVLALILLALSAQYAPSFTAIQPELFGAGGTFVNAWADYDADGDLDLFVGVGTAPNRLYRNDRGRFVDVAATAGLAATRGTRAGAWADYDQDGDVDLLVGLVPGAGSVLRLFRNTGGTFEDVTAAAGLGVDAGAVRQPAWVDVDGDADLDLFVAFRDRANMLFVNRAGRFSDEAPARGLADARKSVGAVWFDYDEDDDLDVYVANMDGDANGLFRNDRGTFSDVAAAAGVAWGGRAPREAANGTVRPCAADVNNDGRLDLFAANYGPNGLFLNRGGGTFEEVSAAWGVAIDARYDTCAFADMDNDGDLDLYVNGTVTGGVAYRDYLFRNTGTRFEDVTPETLKAIPASHGATWADFDGDGDLDLALAGAAADAGHPVLRNDLAAPASGRSLQVTVVDARGRARFAGAEVRVFAAGTSRLIGLRLVDAGSGYNTQNAMPVHIGIADRDTVDVEVRVRQSGSAPVRLRAVRVGEHTGRPLLVRIPAAR